MSTYANAPAPRSALFDDAPATQPAIVPGHLIPATRIAQVRGGRWVAVDVRVEDAEAVTTARRNNG